MRPIPPGTVILGLLVGLVLSLTPVSPATASSPAAATVTATAIGKTVDACTAVPDSGPTFDFTAACLDHDTCYIEQPDGATGADRKRCDLQFRRAMMAWCEEQHPGRAHRVERRTCKAVALAYYLGVRLLGGLAWSDERPTAMA